MGSYEYEEIRRDREEQARTEAFELWKTTEEYADAVHREYEKLLADPEILEQTLFSVCNQIDFTNLTALIMHRDVTEFGNTIFAPLVDELRASAAFNVEWSLEQYR